MLGAHIAGQDRREIRRPPQGAVLQRIFPESTPRRPKAPRSNSREIKLLTVDASPVFRLGLCALAKATADLAWCGEVGNPREAFTLIRKSKPDIVLAGLTYPEGSGLDFVKDVRARFGVSPSVLVLSACDEMTYAPRALQAGALGYVMKHEPLETILDAIRAVSMGNVYVSRRVDSNILNLYTGSASRRRLSCVECLSDRELAVFEHIGRGHDRTQIALALSISPKTVESYMHRIRQKLGLKDGRQLAYHAVQWFSTQPH